jgi:hypothetical protein
MADAMTDVDIHDGGIATAAETIDWGVLVQETQGGVDVYIVGLSRDDAASLLRTALEALNA